MDAIKTAENHVIELRQRLGDLFIQNAAGEDIEKSVTLLGASKATETDKKVTNVYKLVSSDMDLREKGALDIESFLRKFWRIKEVENLNVEQAKQLLRLFCHGKEAVAQWLTRHEKSNSEISLEDRKNDLLKEFLSPYWKINKLTEILQIQFKQGQTVQSFINDFETLMIEKTIPYTTDDTNYSLREEDEQGATKKQAFFCEIRKRNKSHDTKDCKMKKSINTEKSENSEKSQNIFNKEKQNFEKGHNKVCPKKPTIRKLVVTEKAKEYEEYLEAMKVEYDYNEIAKFISQPAIMNMGFDISRPINVLFGLDLHAKVRIGITGLTSKFNDESDIRSKENAGETQEEPTVTEELNIPVTQVVKELDDTNKTPIEPYLSSLINTFASHLISTIQPLIDSNTQLKGFCNLPDMKFLFSSNISFVYKSASRANQARFVASVLQSLWGKPSEEAA
ncbi:hypothetical protein O9G_004805, partial [Rozella allomycis CSF55]